MAEVKIAHLAEADLEEIWDYISANNVDSANRLIKDLTQKFRMLAENPEIGRAHDEFVLNLRSFPFKNYLIFYFPIENGAEIYRVIHGARNIEDLFEDFFRGLES
ncbi:MAG: type II toxin-antitoxin system RelE/ParE family toxin [Acidobacteriota bacterium]|nr:type II toxin-antitoxin system RelE/ParE family toxin [Acidobacteriota bacterium]